MGFTWHFGAVVLVLALVALANAEDPYRFFDWNVTYGDIYPLGVRQRVRIRTLSLFLSDWTDIVILIVPYVLYDFWAEKLMEYIVICFFFGRGF